MASDDIDDIVKEIIFLYDGDDKCLMFHRDDRDIAGDWGGAWTAELDGSRCTAVSLGEVDGLLKVRGNSLWDVAVKMLNLVKERAAYQSTGG